MSPEQEINEQMVVALKQAFPSVAENIIRSSVELMADVESHFYRFGMARAKVKSILKEEVF